MSAGPHSFRSLVLPREHGSWSLALEPVALGLLIAPTFAGALLALAAAAGFLSRRPLKLASTLPSLDPRRAAAADWTMLLAGLALVALAAAATLPPTIGANEQQWPLASTISPSEVVASIGANKQQTSLDSLWPLLLALPFGAAFLWFDLRGEMREAEAELCGSAAFALLPAAFATLAGWPAAPALVLAGLMLARSLPTVLVVRAYLRIQKGRPPARTAAWFAALLALAGPLAAVAADLAPFAVAPLAAVLFARAAWLLSPWRPDWPARRIGLLEAAMGALWLLGLALAYRAA